MLVIGDRPGLGDVRSFVRDVGRTTLAAAKQTGAAAVQGAGLSIGQRLQNLLPRPAGGRSPNLKDTAASYLPWVLGGVAVLGVGYLVIGRRR